MVLGAINSLLKSITKHVVQNTYQKTQSQKFTAIFF